MLKIDGLKTAEVIEDNQDRDIDINHDGHGGHNHDHSEIEFKRKTSSIKALDSISCNCGSDACNTVDVASNDHDQQDRTVLQKMVAIVKDNYNVAIGFVVFFFGIFTHYPKSIDLWIYLVAYLFVGSKVVMNAVKGVLKGQMLDENFLMAIASIVAFIIGEFPEGVAVMLFYNVGTIVEHYALDRSKDSISALLDIQPEYANLKVGNSIKVVNPNEVNVGDIVIVKVGEKVPVDGIVSVGETTLDTSAITGESLPSIVDEASVVYSGSINLSAVIEVKVTKTFDQSTVSKIMDLVEKTNKNKAKTESFITKFAKIYTPVVVLAAILLAILPPLLIDGDFGKWVYRAAIFLVVSCPCALVISVPLGYFGGIGGAAKAGILIKGGNFIEALKDANTVVFDKTGTLTKGNFKVTNIQSFDGFKKNEILKMSAHLESFSNHPIAKAIVKEYGQTLDSNLTKDVEEKIGKGIVGRYNGSEIALGNSALLEQLSVIEPVHEVVGSTLYLVLDHKVVGILDIMDELKEDAKESIEKLTKMSHMKTVILTGDRKHIAEAVGKKLGIDQVYSQLLPHEKVEHLERLLKEKGKGTVVFVGDGVNDAPVLTMADVGIAMGALGSDAAIEAADIVLMTDEVSKVSEAIKISKFTSRVIWQNIILAMTVKIAIMILGTMGIANMWTAVFGDVGVAILAILNSGRIIASVKK